MRLSEYIPGFSAELETALVASGHRELGGAFADAAIIRFTYDASCGAAYIYLEPARLLNIAEAEIIGVKHGRTIEVDHPFWVNVDVDNFGRPQGIELLSPSSVFVQRMLAAYSA